MPMNQFASQKEVMFITYEDVIKTTKFLILKKLLTDEFRENYQEYIDYSKFDNLNDDKLMDFIYESTDMNILKYLSTVDLDWEATYIDLYLNTENILKESRLLSIGQSINVLLKQSFTDKIYIYTPYNDQNIYKDIYDLYGTDKIIFAHGDFNEVIEEIHKTTKITSYVLNDINLLNNLIEMNKVAYTNILICNAGWNFKLNERNTPVLKIDNIDDLSKEKVFKIGVFSPTQINR